jgi:chromatin remodeling complex protein RSC6
MINDAMLATKARVAVRPESENIDPPHDGETNMADTKKTPAKKAVQARTSAKDAEENTASPKKRAPADAMKDITPGSAPAARPFATKKVWEYIKKVRLQDSVHKK